MKFYLILLVLFISCRPGLFEMPTSKTLASELQNKFPSVTSAVSLKNAPSYCGLPPCEHVLPEAEADLQAVADLTCQAIYGCVDCCLDGKAASATLYVEPKGECPVKIDLPKE